MNYKTNFRESTKVHLKNVLNRGAKCGLFNSFYSEGKKADKRCLLGEYKDDLGDMIFTRDELKEICPFYDDGTMSKCFYEINHPSKKEELIKILKQTIFQLKGNNHLKEKKLSKNLKTFLNFP